MAYDRQGNDGKKDKIRSTRIKLVAEYETDAVWNLLMYEDLELLVSWQNQRNGTSREIGIWWRLQEAFYKVRTGEIFDLLEVKIS